MKRNVYFRFAGLPNIWLDDFEKSYPEEFFLDKEYEDISFDNFFDLDAAFGYDGFFFGTIGLPVGHPKRTSKSFDMYNEKYGPFIVRVVKDQDENLKEDVIRIKNVMDIISK
jgi:hypothetical protein